MSLSHSPLIVRDGLVLCLDTANPRSYPKSGTTWSDLAGANDGTLTNMDASNFSSSNGGSLSFDGSNEYVHLGDPSSTEGVNGLTVSAWVSIDQFSPSADAFFSRDGAAGSRGWYLGSWNHSNTGGLNIVRWLMSTDGSSTDALNTSELLVNTWYSVTGTWDNSKMKIYVNGFLNNSINTSNTSSPTPNLSESLKIGLRLPGGSNYFNGNLALGQIYNRALTAEEVQQNYRATKGRYK